MSDSTSQAPATQVLLTDLSDDVAIGKQFVAAFKANGINGLVAAAAPLIPKAEQEYKDVIAALPEIKAGYKTTEFWMVVGVGIANIVAVSFGKTIPFDVNVLVTSLVGIYTIVRGVIKGTATPTTA